MTTGATAGFAIERTNATCGKGDDDDVHAAGLGAGRPIAFNGTANDLIQMHFTISHSK
jgi:hypothetical protein